MMTTIRPLQILHLADLTPSSLQRTWLTAAHPNLPIVATCGSDKSVRIYSLTDFNLLSTISGGHKRSVRSCVWKPHTKGESVLATGSFDATAGIWRRWDNYYRREEDGRSTADGGFDDDDNESKAGGEEDDEEEWRFTVLLEGHDSEVKSVSWSPSGTFLATCSRDKSIWIWEDLDDGDNNFETVAVLQEHSGDVKCVSWHPAENCLASASYDDTIRIWTEDIDDWGQVACLKGHRGTVWYIDWEGVGNIPCRPSSLDNASLRQRWAEQNALSGPRLVSCSDDRTVRIWRRKPREHQSSSTLPGIPSIIRPVGLEEAWFEDANLPAAHDLSIYAVAWSKRTGLVASTGADGRIVLYEERFSNVVATDACDDKKSATVVKQSLPVPLQTEWNIIAKLEAAHGIFEINHISWAKRADRGNRSSVRADEQDGEEEILITTADDGSIKTWVISPIVGT